MSNFMFRLGSDSVLIQCGSTETPEAKEVGGGEPLQMPAPQPAYVSLHTSPPLPLPAPLCSNTAPALLFFIAAA